jgi:uncharacterized protein (DUF1778 family)
MLYIVDNMSIQRDYTMSLRLNADEADRIRKVCKYNQQTISDFVRTSVRRTLETEELRILQVKSERVRLEKMLKEDKT